MRGGTRSGAGRKPGSKNVFRTADDRAKKYSVVLVARRHSDAAIAALADVVANGSSESARVSASIALLDRAWGKPTQVTEVSGPDGAPIAHRISSELSLDEVRDALEKRGLPTEIFEE